METKDEGGDGCKGGRGYGEREGESGIQCESPGDGAAKQQRERDRGCKAEGTVRWRACTEGAIGRGAARRGTGRPRRERLRSGPRQRALRNETRRGQGQRM